MRRLGRRGRVYPRVCGGTVRIPDTPRYVRGLSPRVRGNPLPDGGRGRFRRSIPACAGEPVPQRNDKGAAKVYPRVCGGTPMMMAPMARPDGLSPRVRGNLRRLRQVPRKKRSIPACAGEPTCLTMYRMRTAVYPRVCGGTVYNYIRAYLSEGLSPRVRGNRNLVKIKPRRIRSIPACAGEPSALRIRPDMSGVYPRVCGGTAKPASSKSCAAGLSPRVRGNPTEEVESSHNIGSIPACAGEPLYNSANSRMGRVYPRVCGGTTSGSRLSRRVSGLSPRVRGNPLTS